MSDAPSFSRLYPAEETTVFDGGLDTKFERSLLPDNESPDCLNVEFINGSVTTRQGSVRLNTNAAGNVAFDGLYTRRGNDGGESMCAFIGGHMLVLGATTFNTIPSAQSVFTMGQRVGAELAENYLFIGNGGAGPYKYDGLIFTRHGISAPVTTCSVASATTGSLTTGGQYIYRVTNVNTHLVQSDMGPSSTTFIITTAGGGLSTTLTSIPVGSFPSQGVNDRYIYRTLSGGSTFFQLHKMGDNTTTSYTDTTSDSALGAPAPTDQGVPPLYNVICYHQNILFVNDSTVAFRNYVRYSAIGSPYSFPSTNFFKVGDNTSDLVVGFASYDNYIVIFCERSTWINFMPDPTDPTTWRQIKSNSPYGSKSPYCLLHCNVRGQDLLLHPAVQNGVFSGFGALTGTTLDPNVSLQPVTSAGSDLQSQIIEPDMFNVQAGFLSNISGVVYKNRAFVSLTYNTSSTTNNRIYVWDFSISNIKKDQIASWVPWTGLSIQQFTIFGGKLYGCSSTTNGFVYQLGDTMVYNDDGAAINSYHWTKEFPGFAEDTTFSKDFRYINMMYDNAGSYFMSLMWKTDSDTGAGSSVQINLVSGGTVWGTGANGLTWGVGTWGGGVNQTESRQFLGAARGKRLQYGFSNQNTVNQRFKVYHAQFKYNIRGYR